MRVVKEVDDDVDRGREREEERSWMRSPASRSMVEPEGVGRSAAMSSLLAAVIAVLGGDEKRWNSRLYAIATEKKGWQENAWSDGRERGVLVRKKSTALCFVMLCILYSPRHARSIPLLASSYATGFLSSHVQNSAIRPSRSRVDISHYDFFF